METAVTRYRDENSGARIPDITAERLQGCVEEFGGQLTAESNRVLATVQVDPEGRTQGVTVAGVPESDFAACVRVALQDMAVPDLALRRRQETAGQTAPMGNELANPVILWEVGVMLAELLAAHGGKTVLYTVSVEVLSVVAVSGVNVYLRKKRKDRCTDYYEECVASQLYRDLGRGEGDSRCGACANMCVINNGNWPSAVGNGTCVYKKVNN